MCLSNTLHSWVNLIVYTVITEKKQEDRWICLGLVEMLPPRVYEGYEPVASGIRHLLEATPYLFGPHFPARVLSPV